MRRPPSLTCVLKLLRALRQGREDVSLIQRGIPQFIDHLDHSNEAGKNDESSPLWRGHLKTGAYIKQNVKLVYKTPNKEEHVIGPASMTNQHKHADENLEITNMR